LGNHKGTLPSIFLSKNHQRQVERRFNLRLLLLLIVIFLTLYILTGYRGWLLFFFGFAGAWLFAAIWIHSLERNLWIERNIHQAWAAAGQSVPEKLKLVNHGWFPAIWIEITDSSSSLETPIRLVSDVAHHSSRTRYLSHLFKRRGLYTLGPTQIRCGDPFGIYTLTLFDENSTSILITPPLLNVNQIKIATGGFAGNETRRRGVIERDVSGGGVREYVPGDSLRYIHWPASAHFDNLIVRQLESAKSRDWWIFADLDHSAQTGHAQNSTLELVVVLAASLAVRGLEEHRRIGLALAGPQLVWLEPSAASTQRWQILRALAMADAGNCSLEELFSLKPPPQSATAIIITPSSETKWISRIKQHCSHGNAMVLLINPGDFIENHVKDPLAHRKITSILAQIKIPYHTVPGALLSEVYSHINRNGYDQ